MSAASPVNVLVVDPDPEARGSLAELLASEGLQPTALDDPRRAPEALRESDFQMVFLDLGAPEDEGVELLRAIRAEDENVCVFCLTGTPSVEAAVASMKHRAFDYIAKPIDGSQLRPRLAAAVKEHGLVLGVEEQLNARIGARVRARRHERGMTLKQVAQRTGLSVSLISQIELGRSAASILSLHKLSLALDVPMAWVFGDVP